MKLPFSLELPGPLHFSFTCFMQVLTIQGESVTICLVQACGKSADQRIITGLLECLKEQHPEPWTIFAVWLHP